MNTAWLWLPEHEEEFYKARKILTSPALVKPFDPSLRTQLLTDASKLNGLGFALIQREKSTTCLGRIRLVQCGSCSLSAAQKNYATVELELSAVWFAVQKCAFYLRGMPKFEVITDHRPLLGIFKKPLANFNNTRLQRLRENLDQFSFNVTWSQGKNHLIADALSRFPVFAPDPSLDFALCSAIKEIDPAFKIILDYIDQEYNLLKDCIEKNRPLPPSLSPFGEISHEIRLGMDGENGLLLVGDRLIVPRPARRQILELMHMSHSGINKTIELANQLYYWPGMRNEFQLWVRKCATCVTHLPSQSHEPIQSEMDTASFPMEAVSTDLFEISGKTFLIMVDRFSGFPLVALLRSTTTETIWKTLLEWFHMFGFPKKIKSDNGPQFRQKFGDFCAQHDIIFSTSSPYNPRSNGLAEAAVKSVKNLLKKGGGSDNTTFRAALLEWRSTPRTDGFSPAVGFFGRNPRTRLPTSRSLGFQLESMTNFTEARKKATDQRVERAGGQSLPPLAIGQVVHIQNPIDKEWSFRAGIITSISKSGRSYTVTTNAGRFVRNRRFLRPSTTTGIDTEDISQIPIPNDPITFQPIQPRRSKRNHRFSRVSFKEHLNFMN